MVAWHMLILHKIGSSHTNSLLGDPVYSAHFQWNLVASSYANDESVIVCVW